MKKILFLMLTAVLITASVSAEDYMEGMTQGQKLQFLEKALSITERAESKSNISTDTYDYGLFLGRHSSANATSSTTMHWDPYEGPAKITKSSFFKMVGNDEYYSKCLEIENIVNKKHKSGKVLTTIGGVGIVTGLLMAVIPLFTHKDDDSLDKSVKDLSIMYTGCVVGGLACIPFGIGISLMEYKKDVDCSANFANGMADIYNQKLALTIKQQF